MPDTTPGAWETALTPHLIARQRTVSAPRPSPDGSALAFVSEFDGRADLFTTVGGGWPLQITADHPIGGSYAWSPDGARVVFASSLDGKLWLCPATGGAPTRFGFRDGRHHSPRFSPDGTAVAFLCDRGDEIDVIAAAIDGSWQRVVNRGSDFPLDPSWSSDGRSLVWHAYPHDLMPWDQSAVVAAEIGGGEPRIVASAPRTAFASARFSPRGDRIVCVCDAGGFLNVTEMDLDGRERRVLHEDRWEHGEPAYSPDGSAVVHTRNVDGDCTLWIVPSGGGAPRPLTDGPGRAGGPVWTPDGRDVLYVHESPTAPPGVWEVEVATGRRRQRTFPTIGGIAAGDLATPEHVEWTSGDGFNVHGLLYAPKRVVAGRHPCLVEIHGGPMNQSRSVWNPLLQYFVQRGWAVVQPNYRGSLGYGRAYREALFGSWGKGDLADNLGAIDLCAERGLIRTDRVVAWGGSAGAYSTLVGLTQAPARFSAGVALFGIYDLYGFALETHRYERFYVETILGSSAENQPLWRERSPLHAVDRVRAPLLLLHGGRDPAALPLQSETLADELKRCGVDHEYAFYPDEGHGFRRIATNVDYALRMDRFLSQKVLHAPMPGPLGTLPYPAATQSQKP